MIGRAPAAVLLAVGAAACASMNPPPGGPADSAAPVVVEVTPDSGAVNVRPRSVVFRFDEVVNDRLEPSELDRLVLLSPMDGEPRIDWSREEVSVRPRGDWRPNTTYTITLLPGVADLRSNKTQAPRVVVFSTGPQLATQTISGRTFDWPAERTAANALVEARPRIDTTTAYLATADSGGVFVLGPLDAGDYLLRGWADANRNRQLDRGEAWDSVTVVLQQQRAVADLYLAPRDTLPPRILSVSVIDSVHVAVEFDRAIDPSAPVTPQAFTLRASDSSAVAIVAVQTRRAFDDERRRADSVAAARADTTPRPPAPVAAQPARPPVTPAARPNRPPPATTFVLTVGTPLRAGATYRLSTPGLAGLTRRSGASDRSFTVPQPPVPPLPDGRRP